MKIHPSRQIPLRMTTTRIPLGLVLGLAAASCGTELDVGDKPQNLEPSSGEDSGTVDPGTDDGPGMTSAMGDSSTGELPPSFSPPCELAGAGAAQDSSVQWGLICGGSASEYIRATAMDDSGAVYVLTQVENYQGQTILFGDDEITPGPSQPTLVLTKLAADGTFEWNRGFQGEVGWWAPGSLVACDDRVYFTANRASSGTESIDFGTGLVNGNLALVAVDGDGTTLWAQATGQNDEESGGFPTGSVVCRPGGGIAVFGVTATDMEIGGIAFDGSPATAAGTYVVVADADGNGVWGELQDTGTWAAALDDEGSLVTFGYRVTETPNVSTLALTRYDATGTEQWAQLFPTTGPTLATGVMVDADGTITITGGFAGETDLGQGPLLGLDPLVVDDPEDPFDRPNPIQNMDSFVARYAADGTSEWVTALGELGWDSVGAARLDADGNADVFFMDAAGAATLRSIDGTGAGTITALPGPYPLAVSGNPLSGIAVAYGGLDGLSAFAPPLTARMPYDFVVTRIVP